MFEPEHYRLEFHCGRWCLSSKNIFNKTLFKAMSQCLSMVFRGGGIGKVENVLGIKYFNELLKYGPKNR